MSNMNADTKNLVLYTEAFKTWLGHFAEDVMDQQVVKTDMKLRHIFNKAVEVGYRKKYEKLEHSNSQNFACFFSWLKHNTHDIFFHQASDIWMNKIKTDVPYVEILKNRIEEMEMPTLPEKLFMNL